MHDVTEYAETVTELTKEKIQLKLKLGIAQSELENVQREHRIKVEQNERLLKKQLLFQQAISRCNSLLYEAKEHMRNEHDLDLGPLINDLNLSQFK